MDKLSQCPHCGKDLHPDKRVTYRFSWWATGLMMVIISLMLFAFDLIDDGQGVDFMARFTWAPWAVLGMWILFASVQLIRFQPYYGWLMIPVSGVLFSIFVIGLDKSLEPNNGFLGLDWSWYVVIPVITFVVILPVVARIARQQPSHYDRLEYLVEYLEENQ